MTAALRDLLSLTREISVPRPGSAQFHLSTRCIMVVPHNYRHESSVSELWNSVRQSPEHEIPVGLMHMPSHGDELEAGESLLVEAWEVKLWGQAPTIEYEKLAGKDSIFPGSRFLLLLYDHFKGYFWSNKWFIAPQEFGYKKDAPPKYVGMMRIGLDRRATMVTTVIDSDDCLIEHDVHVVLVVRRFNPIFKEE